MSSHLSLNPMPSPRTATALTGGHFYRKDTRSVPNSRFTASRIHISQGIHFVKLLNDWKHLHCHSTLRDDVLSSARLVYYNYGLITFVVLESPASPADRSDFQGA